MIYKDPVVLVGGGSVGDTAFELSQKRARIFVGADGGGDEILRRGAVPEAVIGDLDSLSAAGRGAIPDDRLYHVAEQDSTDFEKALSRIEAPLIYAIGFTGARLDHQLAAFHALVRFAHRRVILIGADDIILHLPAQMALSLPAETRVSLFPMGPVEVGMTGLEWSFRALELEPGRRIGTSNRALGGAVHLRSDRPGCLLILPVSALDVLADAMPAAEFHSPRA